MPAAEKGYAENGMGSQAMAQAQGNAETDKQLDQLKHIVSRTLEAKGVLGTIRAQLRAAVFTALDEQERASGVYLENNRVQKIKESDEGRLLAGLLHECFEFYELDRTLSVFMPETTWALEDYSGRQQLSAKLGLEPDAPSPLLLQILRDRLTMGSRSATKPERKSVASSISSCTTSPLSKSESRGVERSPVSANTSEIGSPPSARSSRQSSVASRSPRSGNTDSRSSERKPLSSSSTATSPSAADARLPSTRLKSSSGFSDGALDTKPVIMANVAAPMLSGTMEQEIAQSKAQFDPEFYMSSPSSREAELRARKDEMFSPADRSSIAQEEEESKLTIKDIWSGSMSSPSVVEDIAESDNQSNSYRSQSPSFEEHAQLQEPLSGKSHASNFSKSTSHSEDESENFHQGLSIVGEQDDDDAEAIRGLASQSKSQLKASPISSSPYSFGSDMGEFGVQLDLKSNTQPIAEYDNDNEEDSENEDSDMGSHSDQAIEESASHQSESPNIGDNMQLQEPLSSKSRSSKLSKSASNGSHLEDEEESYGRDMAEDGDSNEFEEEEVESLASQSQSSHKASPMSSSPYSFESDTEGFGVQLGSKPPVPAISGSGDGKDEVESSHGDENSEDSISHRSGSPVIGDKMQSQEPLSGKSGSSKLSKSTFSVNHSEDEEEELELENLASQSKSHSKATPMSSSPYSFESDVEGFGVQLGSKPLTQATTEDDNNDEKDGSEDEDQSVSRHDAEDNEESTSHHSELPSFEDHAEIQEPLSGKSRSSKLSKSASNVSHSEDEEESYEEDHELEEDGDNDDSEEEEVESLASQSQPIQKASPMSSSPYSFESDMEGFGVQLGSKPLTQATTEDDNNDEKEDSGGEDIEESTSHHSESPSFEDHVEIQEPLSGKSRSSKLSKSASNVSHSEDEEESYEEDHELEEDGDNDDSEEEEVESLASQSQPIQKASPMSSSPYSFESDTEGFGVQLGSKPPVPAISGSGDGKDEVESSHGDENSEDSISHRSDSPVIGDKMQSQEPLSGKSGSSKLSKSTFSVNHSEDEEEELELENLASQSKSHSKATPMSSSPYSFESDVEGFGVQLGSKPLTQATTEDDNNDEKDGSEDEDQSVSRHDAEDNEESGSHHSESLSFEDHVEIQEPLSGKSRSSKLSKSAFNVSHSEVEEESCDHDMAEDGGNDGDEVESLASQSQSIHEASPMNSSRFSFESDMEGFGVQLGSKPLTQATTEDDNNDEKEDSGGEDIEESTSHHSESPSFEDHVEIQEPLSGKSRSSKLSKSASNVSHSEDEEESYEEDHELEEDGDNDDSEEEEVESLASQSQPIQKASPMSSSPYSFESDTEGFGVQLGSKPPVPAISGSGDGKDEVESSHGDENSEDSISHRSDSPVIGDKMQSQEPLSGKSGSSKLSKSTFSVNHSEDEEEELELENLASQSKSHSKATPMSSSPYSFESDVEGFGVQLGSKPLTQATTEDDNNDEKDGSEDEDQSVSRHDAEDNEESGSHHSESLSFEDHVEIQEPLSGKSRSSKLSKSAFNVSHSEVEEESCDHDMAEDGGNDGDEVESLASQSQSIHEASPMNSSRFSFESDMEGFGVQLGSKPPVSAIAASGDGKDEDEISHEDENTEESVNYHRESPVMGDNMQLQEPLSGKSHSSDHSKIASPLNLSEHEEEIDDNGRMKEEEQYDAHNDEEEEDVESLLSQRKLIQKASPMSSSPYSFESDMEGFGVQLGSKPLTQATTEDDNNDGKDDSEDEDQSVSRHDAEDNEESTSHHSELPSFEDHAEIQEPLSGKSRSSKLSKSASNVSHSEDEEESYEEDHELEEDGDNDDSEEEEVESLASQSQPIQKASPMSSSPYSFESDMEGFGVQLGSKPLTQATTEDDNNDEKEDSGGEDIEESTSHHSESPSFEDHVEIQEPLSGKSRSSKLSKSASNVSHSEDEEESYEEDHELEEDGDNDDSEEEEVESLASQSQPIQKASPMSSSPYSFESDMEGFGVQLGSKPLTQATTEEDSNDEKDDSEDEDNEEFASHHSEAPSFEDHLEIQEPLSGKSHSSKIYKSTSNGIHSEDEEESYDYDMTEDGGNDEVDSSHVDEDAEDSVSHRSESSDIADNIQLQEPLSGKSHSSKLSNESHSEDEEENYGRELTEDVSNEEDEEVEKVATSNHESSRLSSSPYSFESDTEGFGVQLGSKPLAQANTKDDSDSDSEGEDGDFDVKNHTAKDLCESNSRHSESPAIGDNMQLQEPLSAKSHSSKLSKSASRASHLEDEEEDYNHDMAEDSDNVNNENGEVESISSQSRSILKASPTSSSPNSLESGMEGFGVQFGSKPLPQFVAKDSTDSEGDDEDGDFSANNRTSEDASEFHSHGSKSPATGNNTQVQEPLSGKSRSSEVSKSISNAGHSDEEDDEESYNHELANEEEQDDDNDDIEEEAERFAFQSKSIHKGSPMSSSPSSFGSDMEVEGFGVHFGSKSPAQAIAKDGDGMEDENRSETESVSPHSREAAGREEAAQKPSLGYDYQNNSFLTQDIISKATEGTPTIDSVQHSLHEDSDGGEFSVSPKEDHERQSNFSQFSDEDQAGVGPLRTSSRDQYSHSTNHEGSIDSHNVEEAEHTNDESEDEEDFSFAPSSGVHKHFHMDNTVGGSHPYSEKVNASKSEEGNQSDVHESVTRDQNKGYGKAHERLASSGRVGLLSSETNEGSFRGSVHSYLQEEEHEEDAGSLSESSHSDKGKVVEYGKAPHAAIADRNSLVEASSTQEEPYSSMGSFDASFDSDEEFGVNIANVIGNKDDVSLSDYSNKVGVNEAEDRKSLETRNDHSNFSKNSMLDEDSDEDKGEGDESDDEYGEDFEDDFEEEEDEEGAEGSVLHNEEISVPSEVESVASLESGSCELSNDGGSKISTEDAKDAEDRSEDTPVAHIKIDLDEQIVESIEFGVSETALQDQCDDIF